MVNEKNLDYKNIFDDIYMMFYNYDPVYLYVLTTVQYWYS